MFSLKVVDTDGFLDMPQSSQLLYFHLAMRADDDGFDNSPKKIMRFAGSKDDDFKILAAKQFIIPFQSGIIVIRHWKENNYIPKDRYTETIYLEEKNKLSKDENGLYTYCIRDVSKMETQVRLGKDRLGKDRGEEKKPTPPLKRISKKKMRENAERFLQGFNQNLNTKYKALSFENNLSYWLEFYSWEDISKAVGAIKQGLWWAGSPDPTLLLRRRDEQGNPVDYIGELVELWRKKNGK